MTRLPCQWGGISVSELHTLNMNAHNISIFAGPIFGSLNFNINQVSNKKNYGSWAYFLVVKLWYGGIGALHWVMRINFFMTMKGKSFLTWWGLFQAPRFLGGFVCGLDHMVLSILRGLVIWVGI